jgi:hypothetical protein
MTTLPDVGRSGPVPDVGRSGSAVRRRHLARAALAVTSAGLLTTAVGPRVLAVAADPLGDALYAALVYVVLAFAAPRTRRTVLLVVALSLCGLVEVAQLTGVPAALVEVWSPLRYLVGTRFDAVDLLAYALGAVLAALVDGGLLGRARPEMRRDRLDATQPSERPRTATRKSAVGPNGRRSQVDRASSRRSPAASRSVKNVSNG